MLRKYQQEGIQWLIQSKVGILADDMGLGKTVQTIKAMEFLFKNNEISNCIIVAPLSLQKNWENELDKWSPELKYERLTSCLLYTSPSPRDATLSRMPSSA